MASAELSPYLRAFRCLSAAEEEIALNHETIRKTSKKEAQICGGGSFLGFAEQMGMTWKC
jgi:hypothetical protein